MRKGIILSAVLAVVCCLVMGCTGERVETKPVMGTIEEAFGEDSAPDAVRNIMTSLETDDRYELLLEDAEADVKVWSLMRLSDEASAEGFGIMVAKAGKVTALPDIHHGRQPSARYDRDSQTLWLACGEMEGTGVYVERLYELRFKEDGSASIARSIEPYDVQQALCQHLFYSIDGQDISLYDKDRKLVCVTDTVTNMGGFDDEPVWIGEQLRYDLSGGKIRVLCTPGLKYVTGLVLTYDAMPTVEADMTFNADGSFELSDIATGKELEILD